MKKKSASPPQARTGQQSDAQSAEESARWEQSSQSESVPSPGGRFAGWTFLTNHAHVLVLIEHCPDMVLREVAQKIGITERAVQRIVHDLEAAGYLTITRVGRQNHYSIDSSLQLRHPIESHCNIGALLKLVHKP